MRHLLIGALALLATVGNAGPIDTAVSAPDRPADARAMDAGRHPVAVLTFLGVHPGERVLDVLAGGGYYSEIIARAVAPGGSVVATVAPQQYAHPEMTEGWAALRTRAPNVTLRIIGATDNPALAPASFDLVFMHLVYHDLYWESAKYGVPRTDPNDVLKQVYTMMKPGGVIGVIDHVANPGGDTRAVVDALHRIDPATLKADFLRAGFVFDGESNVLRVPGDDHTKLVFDPAVRGKTDRVVYRFHKPV